MNPLVSTQQFVKPSCSAQVNAGSAAERCNTSTNPSIEQDARLAAELARQELQDHQIDPDCVSDVALAHILQKQFDTEYDSHLKKEESRINGDAKVRVSLDNFKRTSRSKSSHEFVDYDHAFAESDDDDSFYDLLENNIDSRADAWDAFEKSKLEQRSRIMGRAGFLIDEHGNVITKHDIPTASRRNMCRLMELKTDIQTGDAGTFKDDFRINNNVYNRLKVHAKKGSRRASQRAFEKNKRENESILQDIHSVKMSCATRAIMDGLLIAFKIEKLNGVVGHGKESTVLHATGRDHEDKPGQEVAIKIFNSDNTLAFKSRDTYNKSKCPSYKFEKPKSKNDSLNKWAEHGFKNLKMLRRCGINCPDAISLKKHVLVMTFVGSDARPAPQLKEAKLDHCQLVQSYKQVVNIMIDMYQKCGLIHGDLSEYNLLWHENKVYVIDVCQSMFTSHPNANSFLFRDCENILDFYQRSGLTEILEANELFKMVCGKDLGEKNLDLWTKIENFPKNEKLMQRDQRDEEKFPSADNFEQMLSARKVADEIRDEQ